MITVYPHETPDLESSTEAYAGRFAGPVGQFFLHVQTANVLSLLPPAGQCRVLDVGGGHGQLALPLVREGYDVTIVGSDDSCRARLDRIVGPDQYQFRVGSLLDLPCEDTSFDVVLAFRMLPHLEHWRRFLEELCRVAKRSLVVDYPDLCSVNRLAAWTLPMKRRVEENTRPYRCFRRVELLAQLTLHGFRAEQLRGQFFFPMALHRWMRMAGLSQSMETAARVCGLTQTFGSPVILRAQRSPYSSP